ncbi:MAG: hypothetical protein ABEI31_10250 [Halodesulfurarchaeum sp.]
MIGPLVSDGAGTLADLLLRVALADLASWQEAGIAFGFVLGILVVGFLLERWGVALHE